MTQLSSRARAKVRRERDNLEDEAEESGEINLVPYLDIVTNILMFLLVTISTMVVVGNIEIATPERRASQAGPSDEVPEKAPLNLTVAITGKGFIVAGSGGVLYENDVPGKLPTIPKLSGDRYNYEALSKLLVKIKKQYPEEKQAILAANPDIQYEIVIGAMDVLRVGPEDELLFPSVLFSTGFQ
jgi:biopolymer transport protein ExbD